MIVGIGHTARVGKDTAAQALVDQLGFKRVGFADKLKELAMEANPLVTSATRTINTNVGHGRLKWVVAGMGWEGAKNTYPEVRTFLQDLGLGARKIFGEAFWVQQTLSFAHDGPSRDLVIPDVRFESEAKAIRAFGGVLVKIERPGFGPANSHVSEHDLDGWDWDEVLVNALDVEHLQASIVAYVKNLQETT